jgi:Icc-related predicted phosphoesterase
MKICCISDTHGKHNQLDLSQYSADVLIHAGDWTARQDYSFSETKKFLEWFSKQSFSRKLLIAGNHELQVEADIENFLHLVACYPNITYLHNSEVTINNIKFYGSPYSNEFYNWAFMEKELNLSKIWAKIPEDTNVLITHGPAYKTLDLVASTYGRENPHVGSESLHHRKLTIRDNLKLHISGHIHESYGIKRTPTCINICPSVLDERYQLVNKPIVITI